VIFLIKPPNVQITTTLTLQKVHRDIVKEIYMNQSLLKVHDHFIWQTVSI